MPQPNRFGGNQPATSSADVARDDSPELDSTREQGSGGMSTNPRKRRYISNAFTTRKRAAMACDFCRLRKTKCDNARPKCGNCRHHNATCVYTENTEASAPEDDANTNVMHRLDEIKYLLQQVQAQTTPKVHYTTAAGQFPLIDRAPSISESAPEREAPVDDSWQSGESFHAVNPYDSPYRAARCEAVVRWPIFRDWLSEKECRLESFLHEAEILFPDGVGGEQPLPANLARGDIRGPPGPVIDEDDCVPLCKRFLSHVHFRNPILEPRQLISYAKEVSQHGMGWDGRSCLVLVISAISCILLTNELPPEPDLDPSIHAPPLSSHIHADPGGVAEAFAQAAKKRLGLLGMSMIDIQCLFFMSIYEKLRIRPLQSWFCLQQACSRLKSHLMSRSGFSSSMDAEKREQHQIEQRVFWSCVRSETELLPDLCLPSSGLDAFQYPEFPSPPSATNNEHFEECSESSDSGYVPPNSQAQSWLFFLAEISLRRTINAHLRLLYGRSESYWLSHLPLLLRHHAQCEEQISLWYSHLPSKLQFSDSAPQPQSLSYYLESRFQDWREHILRPLLYCALHHSRQKNWPHQFHPVAAGEPSPSTSTVSMSMQTAVLSPTGTGNLNSNATLYPQVLHLAQMHIDLCASLIPHSFEHGRYGGVWQLCRRTFICGMALLASVISEDLQSPNDWVDLCRTAIRYLTHWGAEARSVEAMRLVLEKLFDRVLRNSQGQPSL
ncbi:uncharacterized protein PV06_06368 [Exophiala oligosperma]|uniref:Zn(2)-C6 fungal-type domain-containing protein n=1 Tax=Exophiala oligosperma TaxID=215243 RepID=A0A0D2DKB1_9EURO|nr:uncharacterized protein PV06_06368 [Exophiala oligosperma]KIW42860.1 hypothetical protein PV06_06368 [Exophiala oligosperma]